MRKLAILVATFAMTGCATLQNTVERNAITKSSADFPAFTSFNTKSAQRVDHSSFDSFLTKYLISSPLDNPDTLGANLIRYEDVSAADKQSLIDYINRLQTVKVSTLDRNEQLAFWINLYNAETVRVILENLPVNSIRDIKSSPFDVKGPWNDVRLNVEGTDLSLDNIENKIVRPVFQDARIHYGLNCAAIGCPNLRPKVFTANNLDNALDEQARAFINNPRGAFVENGKLTASRIFLWYGDDYGGDEAGILTHIRRYAEPRLARALTGINTISAYKYDWRLNSARKLKGLPKKTG